MGIVTDSRTPGEPKETEGSALFQLYQAFASAEETSALAQAYASGIAWGDAKQVLFERLDTEIAPMRAVYVELIQNPAQIEKTLKMGAEKARAVATPFTARLRHAVGLRPLETLADARKSAKTSKLAAPSFKQYRESDGLFYFKLMDAKGQPLLQSKGFTSPKEAANTIAQLQKFGAKAMAEHADLVSMGADVEAVHLALRHFTDATD